jgi:CheY-like chemotaxis protein
MDRHGDSRRFAAMGFAGYLSKPVKPRELLTTLEKVLSRDAEGWHSQTHPLITLNVAQQAIPNGALSGLVLLVEDNLVNQKVARRFLERMGCDVEPAGNGIEAVRAFERGTYRVILMDVQMPHMDGYEATERIRSLESVSGRDRRTPIVALTANAMSGQLDRCLQVGMDALLTKPINVEQLADMLRRFGLDGPETVAAGKPPLDLAALNDSTGGDAEFAADLARSYLHNSRELFAQIRACLAVADRRQVARLAHQLAGASANIHAVPLRELCLELETSAPSRDTEQMEGIVTRLGTELTRVSAALQQDSPCAIGAAS